LFVSITSCLRVGAVDEPELVVAEAAAEAEANNNDAGVDDDVEVVLESNLWNENKDAAIAQLQAKIVELMDEKKANAAVLTAAEAKVALLEEKLCNAQSEIKSVRKK